ncbi:hypothetical protein CMV_001411 [Castanea mollissima]|uniref:Uncharacterized protein n=1 Tax=Castanea mollissima TaxID=60419 RepID=A0A8J4VYB9_9ROSI|nr:hypothetical protein CMV_001411 [Castanea mollissima]
MGLSVLTPLLLLVIFSLLQMPTIANKKSYVVYLGGHSHGQDPSLMDLEGVTNSHYGLLGSILGSNKKAKEAIFYSYTRHINGFAAILNEEEAALISKHPNVVSVFLNKGRRLHTTRSWDFLGLERDGVVPLGSIWQKARFGEDTIIGNLDTGVWPESKSFSDEGIGPIPSKWRGICQHGNKDEVHCNRKLIGARYFNKGYAFYAGTLNCSSCFTARDYDGHGSHTLSTAGGNFVPGASVFSHGNGTAKGGSPKARVAAYKVCWPPISGLQCFDADIIAAFDAAISDGVHVLSVSLGGAPAEFLEDAISIGAFHAVKHGILVVSAAGNSGPDLGTVTNVSPWMLTVGASTIDREFTSYVALGNKKHLKGASLSARGLPSQKFYPLISAADAKAANASATEALQCMPGTLDSRKVKGKILFCLRMNNERTVKGEQAALAGAVGMILANDELNGNDVLAETHLLPASHINFTDGKYAIAYINTTKNPMAYMTHPITQLGTKPAPKVAQFSSRGPNMIQQAILKPDVTAPGLDIIAAYTEADGPTNLIFDKRRIPFNSQSGTSMSCPHVSGIAGLLKTLHPDWSPAAIKSAIMTTASTNDNNMEPMLDASYLKATPFAYGAGNVQPNHAMDPGLIYDLTIYDYLNFLCAHHYNKSQINLFLDKPYACPKSFSLADFNYPSIAVPNLSADSVTITRIVTNVGSPGTYRVRVKAPAGVWVTIKPRRMKFKVIGEKKKFKVILKPKVEGKPRGYVFGELVWSDGKHHVRSPLVVKHTEN